MARVGPALLLALAAAVAGVSAPAAAGKGHGATPRFKALEAVIGDRPQPCDPNPNPIQRTETCPSSNPFDSTSLWYETDRRMTVKPMSGDVVRVGDTVRLEVAARGYWDDGALVEEDPRLGSYFWGGSPSGTLEKASSGCEPGAHSTPAPGGRHYHDTDCTMKALKTVRHGWIRVWTQDSSVLVMTPVAIVADYALYVETRNSARVPVIVVALDGSGRPGLTKHFKTDEQGFLSEVVDRPGKYVVYLPKGWDGPVACDNGSRISYRGVPACRLRLSNRHPSGGSAGATFDVPAPPSGS